MQICILVEMALDFNVEPEANIPTGVEEEENDTNPAIQNQFSDSDSDSDR